MLLDINLCASRPCQNNASCENFRTFYTCNCAAGFEGVNCQTGKTLCQYDFTLGKQPIFREANTGFPVTWCLRETSEGIPYWWCVTTQIWVVLLIGSNFASSNQKQIQIWSDMEFLASFLRHHFAGKLEVASWNDGSFLRLVWCFQP